MSNELLALEDIILYLNAHEPMGLYCKNIEIIKAALKENESLKESLSKEKAAEKSEEPGVIAPYEGIPVDADLPNKLKALEIIKKKEVNVGYLIHRLASNDLSYAEYAEEQKTPNLDIYVSGKKLTQKEFDLLKEALND